MKTTLEWHRVEDQLPDHTDEVWVWLYEFGGNPLHKDYTILTGHFCPRNGWRAQSGVSYNCVLAWCDIPLDMKDITYTEEILHV